MRPALIDTLRSCLGSDFSPAVAEAWTVFLVIFERNIEKHKRVFVRNSSNDSLVK
jgi:hypothetical protein